MSSKKKQSDAPAAAGSSGGGRKPRFPELPPKYSSSRELRNRAEKMRRDRLNKLIEEMRMLVPMISTRTKKSDTTRSSILRLTANFLRVSRLFPQDAKTEEKGTSGNSLVSEGLPHLESMDGFFFILAEDGRILFVSENIDKFIGFSQIELMGFPIFNFAHPGDQSKIKASLVKRAAPCTGQATKENPESFAEVPAASSSSTCDTLAPYQADDRGPRQSFYIRLREKPLAKQDKAQYEHMHVVGHLRKTENMEERSKTVGQYTFIGVMRPVRDRPITELSLVESIQDQYLTRHLPDGRIIYTDHRISTIAGYLPSEVKGKSAFNFFFAEDLPWTTMAMRHMFASANGEGSTVYRLFTQTGELICLQTKGFLEFNKTTNKIESFLCINTVIRPEDSERYLNEQKERFTPFITEVQINSMVSSNPSLEIAQSSTLALPSSEPLASRILQFSSAPSEVSVISKLAPKRSSVTSPPSSMISPGRSSKRPFTQVSPGQADEYQFDDRAQATKLVKYGSVKRKLEKEGMEVEGNKRDNNWQYTARREPVHRTEDGVRVVDTEDQFSSQDNKQTPHRAEDGNMEFQYLMNQMNKSLQDSTNSGLRAENPIQNFLSDERLSQAPSQMRRSPVSAPVRVGSVIQMLPHRQRVVQKSPMLEERSEDPAGKIHANSNPLDSDGSLAEFLSQPTFNHPINNSIPRESEIIKQELLNSSCSEAERIAEKLKIMLAPQSEHQSRNNYQHQEKFSAEASLVLPRHPQPPQSDPDGSELFEILNQDLIFNLDGAPTEEKLLPAFGDQVPSTSS
jgi:PAS domain-containing protein